MTLDQNVLIVFKEWGILINLVIFLCVFLESIIILASFVPGEPLIFIVATLARVGYLNIWLLFGVMSIASFLGYIVDYWVGYFVGEKIFKRGNKLFNITELNKTKRYFKLYGISTVFVSRFIPFVGVIGPLVAGTAKMDYREFLKYNLLGGITWIGVWLFIGYFLGAITLVKDNILIFSILMMGITLIPILIGMVKNRSKRKNQKLYILEKTNNNNKIDHDGKK